MPKPPDQLDVLRMLKQMDAVATKRARARPAGAEPGSALRQTKPETARKTAAVKRRAKRYGFAAKVLIHKNTRYVMGQGINVSRSGVFVAAARDVFKVNELVRLDIRPQGTQTTYRIIARVARFQEEGERRGYGLEFTTKAPLL